MNEDEERFPLPQFVEKLTCPSVNERRLSATIARIQNLQSMVLKKKYRGTNSIFNKIDMQKWVSHGQIHMVYLPDYF